jgi:4-hydroxy-tetrahydrodipicolinate synthase
MAMSTPLDLTGAHTALVTPFRDGDVDESALRELVARQISRGIDGLVPCGTTGEAATMSAQERLHVIETVADEADKRSDEHVPVIAGTGSNDTAKTVDFTRQVADIDGVDAALVVTPYYNKPNQRGMRRHFEQVADEGGLPVVLYNVPSRTGVSLNAATVAGLSEHDDIIAIKEASADMTLDTDIHRLSTEHFQLMSGDDFTTFPLLCLGGRGCVSVVSNILPGIMSDLVHAAVDGETKRARRLHEDIQSLANTLFCRPNPVPTKTALSLLGRCTPEVRSPLYTPDDKALSTIRAELIDYGLLDEA